MGTPHRHRHWHGPHFTPGLLPFLLVAAMVAGGFLLLILSVITVLLTATPMLLVGAGALVFASSRRRRRRRLAPLAGPAPVAPTASRAPDWTAARARFARLQQDYARFECDPLAVLRTPALADVTVPSTARFVAAFAEAQALATDTEPPPEHHARFATAVDGAVRAWIAARDTAERIRLAGIPHAERATVERAIKLLTVARDSAHDAERTAAYGKARTELAKLERSGTLRLPRPAAAALEAAGRGQLPAGQVIS